MTHIEREKATVAKMIALYCRKKHDGAELCPACAELLIYAHGRLDHCPHRHGKPTCKKCATHCYKPDMRERMRAVMRFSGPRMLLYHPVAAIRHMFK